MPSLLTELIRKQTATSVAATFSRSIDAAGEEMAREILRDPAFRAEMQQLLRAAFEQTLKELTQPAPPATAP